MQISLDIVGIGAFTGLAYAVMGAGLVLIYRSTRVINFAVGSIGLVGATLLPLLVSQPLPVVMWRGKHQQSAAISNQSK